MTIYRKISTLQICTDTSFLVSLSDKIIYSPMQAHTIRFIQNQNQLQNQKTN